MSDPTTEILEVSCVKCAETGAVHVKLEAPDEFYCTECSTDFTRQDVADVLDGWVKVLAWIDLHPLNRARTP